MATNQGPFDRPQGMSSAGASPPGVTPSGGGPPLPGRHSVDIRFVTPSWLGRHYVDLRIGRDRRAEQRAHDVPTRVRRMNRVTATLAVQMAASWLLVVAGVFYWLTQSACGSLPSGNPGDVVTPPPGDTDVVTPPPDDTDVVTPPPGDVAKLTLSVELPEVYDAAAAAARAADNSTRTVRVFVADLDGTVLVSRSVDVRSLEPVVLEMDVPGTGERLITVQALNAGARITAESKTQVALSTDEPLQLTIALVPIGAAGPSVVALVSPSPAGVGDTVYLSGGASDSSSTIAKYEWDFEGDGTYDWSSTTSAATTHVYATAGSYSSVLRATNANGVAKQAVAPLVVSQYPGVTITSPASTGVPVGQRVSFAATASDPDGSVAKYEWDFEGDGVFDWSSTTGASITHTYTAEGTYRPTVRVTDNVGLTKQAREQVSAGATGTVGISVE